MPKTKQPHQLPRCARTQHENPVHSPGSKRTLDRTQHSWFQSSNECPHFLPPSLRFASAANDWNPPFSTDAAICTNGHIGLIPTFLCKRNKCQLFSFQVRSSTSSVTILDLLKHGLMRPYSLALFPVSEFVGQDVCSSTPQNLP